MGCDHERDAVEAYRHQSKHSDVVISEAGLFINIHWPYLGASPDGLITTCSCCQQMAVLEVKYPLCTRDSFPDEPDSSFCLTHKSDKTWTLKQNHAYYYQV